MKVLKYLFWGIVLTACNPKSVQLPLSEHRGITDTLYNNSQIWIFNQDGRPQLNFNNKISTTDWIINIDRGLKMQYLLPLIDSIQNLREKKSIHKNETARNYLSYMNPESKRIELVDISFSPPGELELLEIPIKNQKWDSITSPWTLLVPSELSYQEYLSQKAKIQDKYPFVYQNLAKEKLVY